MSADTHTCPIADCGAVIWPDMAMCRIHWRKVPKPMQAAIWREYRTAAGSAAHLAALNAACVAVEKKRATPKNYGTRNNQ